MSETRERRLLSVRRLRGIRTKDFGRKKGGIIPRKKLCRTGDFLQLKPPMSVTCCFRGLHNDGRRVNVSLDRLVGQYAAAVDINLVANGDIVTQDGHVLQAGPLSDAAVPAHDGALDPSVVLDLGPRQDHATLQANTVADDYVGADSDIWSYSAVLADLG